MGENQQTQTNKNTIIKNARKHEKTIEIVRNNRKLIKRKRERVKENEGKTRENERENERKQKRTREHGHMTRNDSKMKTRFPFLVKSRFVILSSKQLQHRTENGPQIGPQIKPKSSQCKTHTHIHSHSSCATTRVTSTRTMKLAFAQ